MLDFDVKLLIPHKIVKIESCSGNSQVMKQYIIPPHPPAAGHPPVLCNFESCSILDSITVFVLQCINVGNQESTLHSPWPD